MIRATFAGMREPNLEEFRASGALENQQAGAPLNAFNRAGWLRHAQLGTWWERVLAVAGLVILFVGLLVFLRTVL